MPGIRRLLQRRRLLLVVFVLAVLGTVSYLNGTRTAAQVGSTTAVVAIAMTPTTTPTDAQIDAAVRQAIADMGGLPSCIGPGATVVIQPNLVGAGWYSGGGVVPNTQVLRTLVDMCEEAGVKRGTAQDPESDITICEGAAGHHGDWGGYTLREATWKAYADTGIDDIPGVNLVDANDVGQYYDEYPGYTGDYDPDYVTEVIKPDFLINRRYLIPNCVAQCDALIRVPTLKNHDLAGFTGGLKLAFGHAPMDIYHGAWAGKWNLLHQEAWGYDELETNARGMADMTYCRPPDLVVIDGLVGISSGPVREGDWDGDGENDGVRTADPYMSCIIASTDAVAADTIGCMAIGYEPYSIPSFYWANHLGIGQNNPGKIEVRGCSVEDIRRWFPRWAGLAGEPGDRNEPYLGGLTISDGIHVCGHLGLGPTGMYDFDPGLCKGELYVDGALVDSEDLSPYKVDWTVPAGASGSHTLTYKLYDGMYNSISTSRMVYAHSGNPFVSAQSLPDGTSVSIGPVVFTGKTTAIDSRTFFVSSADGINGLRVRYGTTAPEFPEGYIVGLCGTMGTTGGQRYLNCTVITPIDWADPIMPRLFTNEALGGCDMNSSTHSVDGGTGPYNLGCLVKSCGVVSAGGTDHFYIDDSSLGAAKKLKVKCGAISQPPVGSYVSVAGLSCCEDNGGAITRMLVPRTSSDILIHSL